jgi:hypothetical protein
MITVTNPHEEYLLSECYSLIVRIVCLKVFYNFKSTAWSNARFQNYKQLFHVGSNFDLPIIYSVLTELEQGILHSIWDTLGPHGPQLLPNSEIWN